MHTQIPTLSTDWIAFVHDMFRHSSLALLVIRPATVRIPPDRAVGVVE